MDPSLCRVHVGRAAGVCLNLPAVIETEESSDPVSYVEVPWAALQLATTEEDRARNTLALYITQAGTVKR